MRYLGCFSWAISIVSAFSIRWAGGAEPDGAEPDGAEPDGSENITWMYPESLRSPKGAD